MVVEHGPRLAVRLVRASALERRGKWRAAALAWEAVIDFDDRDASTVGSERERRRAEWYAALAHACAESRQWDKAVEGYEAAIELDDTRARWHARLGRARARTHRWAAAAEAYEAAARCDGEPRWSARAAAARSRALRQTAAGPRDRPLSAAAKRKRRRVRAARRAARRQQRTLISAGLADSTTKDLDHVLLEHDPARFAVRRAITRMVAGSIQDIRSAAGQTPRAVQAAEPRIFTFWAQGLSEAPAIVRRCHEELRRLHSDTDIVALDAASVGDYATLPAHVGGQVAGDWTKFSDMLRLELLSRHGGVWLDATCLPRVSLLDTVSELTRPSGFFAFRARRAQLASWFMASEPGNYLVAMMREAHYEYWRRYDRVISYYMFHHIFEALYHVDERFHALWDLTPKVSRHASTEFGHAMLGEYDPALFDALISGSFLHKLTYKFDPSALQRDTMVAHLVVEGLDDPALRPATKPQYRP